MQKFSAKQQTYFIVMPVCNEEAHLKDTILSFKKTGLPIIVVDDGSKDKSRAIAEKLGEVVLAHSINLGKGAALLTGCEYAFKNGASAVITVDSDGQHLASDTKAFIDALAHHDIVFGSRNLGYGVPFVRFLGNKFATILINLMFGIFVTDMLCGFRAFNKKAYGKIKWESSGYGVETEMVVRTAKSGLRRTEVPVQTVYHDKVKGVTILDAIVILFDVIIWKVKI